MRKRTSSFTFSDKEMPVRFGKHHLLSRIAADPIGEEFLAVWGVDDGVDQLRVVKCVYPSIAAEAEFVSLFSEEARSLSRLASANIARVMEVGKEGNIPFVAREHVEGMTLERFIETARESADLWPWELAGHVVTEILRGLDYVHRREDLHGRPMGMRHGDVRPHNVLLSFGGEVKLAGFGSTLRFIADEKTNARLSDLRSRYLPPEGLDELEPTVSADIWGAGLIMLLLLGERLPSRRTEREVSWMPPQMSHRVESMPQVLDTFLARALNPDEEFRFRTADEMRRALVEIMARHAQGHPPDELSSWMTKLGKKDRDREQKLVRTTLGKETSMSLEESSQGEGTLGPGTLLDGRYHLLRLLGEGGMGLVFEAEHLGLSRKVAIKVLHDKVVDDEATVERFRREAKIIGTLGHPGIVGASDFGVTVEGYHFLAMDLLEGKPLSVRINERSLTHLELVRVMAQVCDALQAAHDAGVVHRDLKPDNVFLTADGARILDFGIAKSTGLDEESKALTRTGHICGTVDYIAPEQIRGVSQDPRSDIYAAGVIMYEALTGVTPFKGRTVGEALHRAINDKLVSPRKRTGDKTIPSDLEAICVKALSKKAEKRFQTASQMATALRSLLPVEGKTVDVGTGNLVSGAGISAGMGIGVAALVAVAGLGAIIWFGLGGEDAGGEPGKNPDSAAGAARDPLVAAEGPASVLAEKPDGGSPVVMLSPGEDRGSALSDTPSTVEDKPVAEEKNKAAEAIERARDKVEEGNRALKSMQLDRAKAAFDDAIRHSGRIHAAWYGLGKVAFQRGDYDTAVEKVKRSLRHSPGNKRYRIFLGKVYLAAGDKEKAAAQARRVLDTRPSDRDALKLLEKAGGN